MAEAKGRSRMAPESLTPRDLNHPTVFFLSRQSPDPFLLPYRFRSKQRGPPNKNQRIVVGTWLNLVLGPGLKLFDLLEFATKHISWVPRFLFHGRWRRKFHIGIGSKSVPKRQVGRVWPMVLLPCRWPLGTIGQLVEDGFGFGGHACSGQTLGSDWMPGGLCELAGLKSVPMPTIRTQELDASNPACV